MSRSIRLALVALAFAPVVARGSVITFETTPGGGTPTDNQALTQSYMTDGVTLTFGFDTNGDHAIDQDAFFEQIGTDGQDGFASGANGGFDTALAGFEGQLGNWFLRGNSIQNGGFDRTTVFIIQYTVPTGMTVTGTSGEIWDIDGGGPGSTATEQYRVDVFDASNNLIGSELSPLGLDPAPSPNSLDSQPWLFAFSGLTQGINRIEITFVGGKTSGIGLAFNNFSPTQAVPEPASIALLGGGLGVLGLVRLRRRRAA